jgi:hypothetical protein
MIKKLTLTLVIGLMIFALSSCERKPDCMWCTTVAIAPEYGTIIGEGYACGQTLEIIQEGQYYQTDPETGDLRLVMTHCEER